MTEKQMKKILKKAFGWLTDEEIEKSVDVGDPYGWCDGDSEFTINTESGLPSYIYSEFGSEKNWEEVDDALRKKGLFIEPVNGGVLGVYNS